MLGKTLQHFLRKILPNCLPVTNWHSFLQETNFFRQKQKIEFQNFLIKKSWSQLSSLKKPIQRQLLPDEALSTSQNQPPVQ